MRESSRRFRVLQYALTAVCLAAPLASWAQAYPSKPIRVISQFAAGAGGDVGTRIACVAMSEMLGQPVIIENRAGGGGVLAAEGVAHSAPDGYTLLVSTPGTQVMRLFMAKASFDPVKDFQPITAVGQSVAFIIANPAFPPNSMKELLDYARRNPGKVSFGTSGVGSEHHLSAEQIKMLTGVDIVHVPYKAGAQAMTDVISGQIPMSFSISGPVYPALRAGKLKVIAVVAEKRYSRLPDVGTVGEVIPGFEPVQGWIGLFAPAGLPQPILRRLSGDIIKGLSIADTRAKFVDAGFEVILNSPEEFAALIKRQIELVGKILKATGIRLSE
jgi:tripartite-type tricarboxylate transporter receptor subunit TctC